MALTSSERQTRWVSNHSELAKTRKREWIHKARVEGRIPYSEFYTFKGNPRLGQKLAKSLYFAEGQTEVRSNLERLGVELSVSTGSVHHTQLELKHTCTQQCSFFGHTETWVDIEPVAYKIHFVNSTMSQEEHEYTTKIVKTKTGERWVTEANPKSKQAYWIFKRYLKKERKLDFPSVQPVVYCKKCNVEEQLPNLESLFLKRCKFEVVES